MLDKSLKNQFYKFMLVTNRGDVPLEQYLQFIKVCANSGITSVQLREKNTSHESLFQFGIKLKKILDPYNIPLIVNDNVDLALKLDTEGVHLGQSDGNPKVAREILGSDKIIGVSIETLADLYTANELPIDYIGVGAVFPTFSKPDVATIWGIDGLRDLSAIAKHPIIAIGGINESNLMSVMSAGANGIATIGAIHEATNPNLTVKQFRKIIDGKNYD
jgi:thiamine-phosphate pyrophosphorylase